MDRLVIAIALVALLPTLAFADDAATLFSKLKLPKVTATKKWVVFDTGDGPVTGWLLDQFSDEVEMLTRGLVHHRFARKKANAPGELTDADFEALCADLLAGKQARTPHNAREGELDAVTEAALFAHWQRERGKEDVAKKLVALAESKPDHATTIVNAVAENLRWQAILGARDGVGFRLLFERWRRIEELPEHKWTDEARATATHYEFLHRDSLVPPMDAKQLARADAYERAKEFRRLLRDHGLPSSHAKEDLAKMGWEAVPYLIEALRDVRPTRAIRHAPDLAPGSYELVKFQDVARELVEDVMGAPLPKDPREAQELAKDWWDQVQDKGEQAFLVEGVEKGDAASPARAARLHRLYPKEAAAAVKKGIANAKDEKVKADLTALLGRIGG